MRQPRLSGLELRVMEILWTRGALSAREVQELFPSRGRPAYTTVQTTIYRLEAKKALRVSRRIGNANVFEAVISREAAQGRLVDEFLALLGGKVQPVMARLIDSGKLTMADVREAEKYLASVNLREKKG
jgi:BlaI family transcriptional regulator, penicillinase repressor